jgi:hypothetical protein
MLIGLDHHLERHFVLKLLFGVVLLTVLAHLHLRAQLHVGGLGLGREQLLLGQELTPIEASLLSVVGDGLQVERIRAKVEEEAYIN